MENSTNWHVLYVEFGHEQKVFDELLEKSLDCFLPMVFSIRQWKGRKVKLPAPLYPRYVFVNIKSKADFDTALSIESECSFLRFGDEYGRVSKNEIVQLKFMVAMNSVEDVQPNMQLPHVGNKLAIERRIIC